MEALAREIERRMHGQWKHCTICEKDLERLWPVDEKDRETKIARFAKKYGFRLRFYSKGLCAIFDKWPPDGKCILASHSGSGVRGRGLEKQNKRKKL
jgi:hypothetical protein